MCLFSEGCIHTPISNQNLGKREDFKERTDQGRDSPLRLQSFIFKAVIGPEWSLFVSPYHSFPMAMN
jgi:hypothetical protein